MLLGGDSCIAKRFLNYQVFRYSVFRGSVFPARLMQCFLAL